MEPTFISSILFATSYPVHAAAYIKIIFLLIISSTVGYSFFGFKLAIHEANVGV